MHISYLTNVAQLVRKGRLHVLLQDGRVHRVKVNFDDGNVLLEASRAVSVRSLQNVHIMLMDGCYLKGG